MKYTQKIIEIDFEQFRNEKICKYFANKIQELSDTVNQKEIALMEVCGTHTMSVFRYGIRNQLPGNIKLISGPGCPVCVTSQEFIDKAIQYARTNNEFIITTFGDMFRVPGTESSLEKEKSDGADVRVVYSPTKSLEIARSNPHKKVIFLGVGFETTIPLVGATLLEAKRQVINNWFVLSGFKLIPPAMKVLVESPDLKIHGFICPGHVSTIIGSQPYKFISENHNIPCVVVGFEPSDILEGIYMLVKQIVEKKSQVEIQYRRSVRPEGNPKAQQIIYQVFDVCDTQWRGLGLIPKSGLRIKNKFSCFDVEVNFGDIKLSTKGAILRLHSGQVHRTATNVGQPPKGCICGEILKGVKTPPECKLFNSICTPENPVGACMVSSEGTCAAYYKYAIRD